MARSLARETAFKLLFEDTFGPSTAKEMFGQLFDGKTDTLADDDLEYISWLRTNVREHIDEINVIISKYAKGWLLERINRVELSILRLAICEILYRDDVSNAVSINEAVELSKVYSGDEGPAFINGILGAFVKEL